MHFQTTFKIFYSTRFNWEHGSCMCAAPIVHMHETCSQAWAHKTLVFFTHLLTERLVFWLGYKRCSQECCLTLPLSTLKLSFDLKINRKPFVFTLNSTIDLHSLITSESAKYMYFILDFTFPQLVSTNKKGKQTQWTYAPLFIIKVHFSKQISGSFNWQLCATLPIISLGNTNH